MYRLTIAEYARDESLRYGTPQAQFNAWVEMLRKIARGELDVDARLISQTQDDAQYRPWGWLKVAKNSFRAIVELVGDELILHAVLYKDAHTYHSAETLWREYRSPVTSSQ